MTLEEASIQKIGIPRALLYYRYGILWETFFRELDKEVLISNPTDKSIVDAGTAASVDECCLASKTYLGHVQNLTGRCDAVFVPCYASVDPRNGVCTKFQSMTDVVRNTFRDQDVGVLSLLIENLSSQSEIHHAYVDLGMRLGAKKGQAEKAFKQAVLAQADADRRKADRQEERLALIAELKELAAEDRSGRTEAPLTILVAAHPYIAHDGYLGGVAVEALRNMGAEVVFADESDHAKSYEASFDFSSTLPWAINRELIGSILRLYDEVDGVVVISAFPCGPDSMTNDAVVRGIPGIPILNLMIDAQSGTAGIETRLESFVDILRYSRKGGYGDA